MTFEYKHEYCNAWSVAARLTELSKEGWEFVTLIGTPHMIQLTSTSALPDQQEFMVRRAADRAQGESMTLHHGYEVPELEGWLVEALDKYTKEAAADHPEWSGAMRVAAEDLRRWYKDIAVLALKLEQYRASGIGGSSGGGGWTPKPGDRYIDEKGREFIVGSGGGGAPGRAPDRDGGSRAR